MSFYQYGGDTSADNHSALEEQLDVVVVGAGAAGVGCGVILQQLGITKLKIVERYEVGASFARWPEEMRFITPSFTSNGFGLLDLNAITLQTSPAYSLKTEHPGGAAYARYLQAVAKYHQLPISTGVNVSLVRPDPHSEGFLIETSQGMLSSRFVIWAAGEFQYPRTQSIAGAELCIHTSDIRSWRDVEGEAFLIIGGYESGIDAAVHLVTLGKKVLVVEDAQTWFSAESDPSLALSPYTHERLRDALQSGLLELVDHKRILRIERTSTGYVAEAESGEMYLTPTAPILATGFVGSLQCIANRFEWNERR